MNQPPESTTLISYSDILHPALREVSATPAAFQRYLEAFRLPVQPRRILLFSGHMLGTPNDEVATARVIAEVKILCDKFPVYGA